MKDYKYRYFIGRIAEADSEDCDRTVDVTKWETNIRTRVFSPKGKYNIPVHILDVEIQCGR
jgi:hypothetical protein